MNFGKYLIIGKRRITFGLRIRIKPEKEKKEYMFCGGDKNVDRHRGEYLEKGNIFCGGEANHRRKRRKIFGER